MSGYEALSTGDLILCVNLLNADAAKLNAKAAKYEAVDSMKSSYFHNLATNRRDLAKRMKDEIYSREQSQILQP